MDTDKLEENKRLNAYLDFISSTTELINIEEDIDENELDKSVNTDEKYEILDQAFKKMRDNSTNKSLYKSIKVDIKELSWIKYQLLIKGRQKVYDKNQKQEIYSMDTAKNCINNEMTGTKVERLSFKYVWEDLLNLKSTKEFCKYLKKNPDLEKPKHLVDVGFFENNQKIRNNKNKSSAAHEKHTRL